MRPGEDRFAYPFFGGFFIAKHGSTVPLLAALVIGKTLIDLTLHRRSNRVG